jgi:prepilin-type N-terminal cleavage/methylation domain-containing protein
MRSDDRGFTLAELLMVVSILGIISVSVIGAIMIGFKTYMQANEILNASNDVQNLSMFVTRDAQDATAYSTSTTPLCGTGTQTLGMSWSEVTSATGAAVTKSVSYVFDVTTGTITRYACSAGGVTSTNVVAQWVTATTGTTCLTSSLSTGACTSASRGARLAVTEYSTVFTVDGVRRPE